MDYYSQQHLLRLFGSLSPHERDATCYSLCAFLRFLLFFLLFLFLFFFSFFSAFLRFLLSSLVCLRGDRRRVESKCLDLEIRGGGTRTSITIGRGLYTTLLIHLICRSRSGNILLLTHGRRANQTQLLFALSEPVVTPRRCAFPLLFRAIENSRDDRLNILFSKVKA